MSLLHPGNRIKATVLKLKKHTLSHKLITDLLETLNLLLVLFTLSPAKQTCWSDVGGHGSCHKTVKLTDDFSRIIFTVIKLKFSNEIIV